MKTPFYIAMKALLLSFALLAISSVCIAQIPRTISYQGSLTDAAGKPVADGAHIVRFRLFRDSTGGAQVYNEIHGVITKGGLFNATIGTETNIPDSLKFDEPLYLAISIDNGADLSPRSPFTAVPYAFRAMTADALSPSASVSGSQLTGVATGDLTGAYPAPMVGGIQGKPVSSINPAVGQVLQWNGASWVPATAIEPAVSFNVTGGTFQTLTKNVYQKIDFTANSGNGDFDDGGYFSLATDEFTAPTAGYYFFSGMVTVDSRTAGLPDVYLSFAINGIASAYNRFYSVPASYPLLEMSMPLKLQAGDKVSLQISPGANMSTMGGNSYGVVRFSGFKIH